MNLPFGLDLKTAIVTILFMWFGLPFILKLFNRPTQSKTANSM